MGQHNFVRGHDTGQTDADERERLEAERDRVRSQGLGGVPRAREIRVQAWDERRQLLRLEVASRCEAAQRERGWSGIPRCLAHSVPLMRLYDQATRGLRTSPRLFGSAAWGQWVADAALGQIGAFV